MSGYGLVRDHGEWELVAGPFCSLERLMGGLSGTEQDRRARDILFHDSVWEWSAQAWPQDREAATRTSARDYCKSGHVTVAKQVSRHLGGELATFPWDPPGCRVERTRAGESSTKKTMGAQTPSSHHVPCHSCSLRRAASSVNSLAYFPHLPLASCSSVCPLCVPQTSLSPGASLPR